MRSRILAYFTAYLVAISFTSPSLAGAPIHADPPAMMSPMKRPAQGKNSVKPIVKKEVSKPLDRTTKDKQRPARVNRSVTL